jgi:hypothetical protein
MRAVITTAAFVMLVSSGISFAQSPLLTWNGNGHAYQRFDTGMTWSEARTFCEGRGGYLATLTSQEENDFVYNQLSSGAGEWTWLGGTDEQTEGTWEWISGEPWSFENWDSGQPDNGCDNEDYLHFYNDDNSWNDENNDASCFHDGLLYPVCEFDTAAVAIPTLNLPGKLALILLLGIGGMLLLRRTVLVK